MNPVILSADSTCDLNPALKEAHQVHYFPLHIILDGEDYLDNVTITPEEIYQVYYEKKLLPKTAAVNVAEYLEYFGQWTRKGCSVIHFSLGSGISSSFQNARLAAEELENVYVIDSGNLSTGIGLLVLKAADRIREGHPPEKIYEEMQALTRHSHASFILDTLTFMRAGGRCSAVAAIGADLLSIKPCIVVDNKDGSMGVDRKYRGRLERVLEKYVREELGRHSFIDTSRLFITHSGIAPSHIEMVRKTVLEEVPFSEIHVTKASCTISSHCGPNTLGILFMTRPA